MTFELDLWGRLRRAPEAARADLFASEENRQTIRTTLISDVAQSYFELLELDHEAQIDRRTLELRRSSLDLVRKRYESGLTAQLDERRDEQELAVAAAAVPEVERRVVQTENRLSILLGHVRQAEGRLVAANARIGEAKAAFFPRISLTGMFGLESASLSDLFTGPARVWQVGPPFTMPIFNASRIASNYHATEAREREDPLYYRLFKSFLRGSFEGNLQLPSLNLLDADRIVAISEHVVREAATAGRCVIVGRGGQYFLSDRSDAYHVFVYAPYEEKIRRERAAGQSAADAAQLVETVDLERAAFIKRYFARDWPNRPLYDLMLNSKIGDDRAVETIVGDIRVFESSGAVSSASG